MAAVYKYLAGLVFLAVIVQIGFAGYGAFSVAKDTDGGTVNEDRFEDVFGMHSGFGYLVVLLGLILLVVSLVARHRVKHTLILFGLLVLQVILAWIGFEVPWVGFFHPINAMADRGAHRLHRDDRVPGRQDAGARQLALLRMVVGVAPVRNGVATPTYARCIVRPAAAWSRLWQCSIQSPGLSARNATRTVSRARRRACPSTTGCPSRAAVAREHERVMAVEVHRVHRRRVVHEGELHQVARLDHSHRHVGDRCRRSASTASPGGRRGTPSCGRCRA